MPSELGGGKGDEFAEDDGDELEELRDEIREEYEESNGEGFGGKSSNRKEEEQSPDQASPNLQDAGEDAQQDSELPEGEPGDERRGEVDEPRPDTEESADDAGPNTSPAEPDTENESQPSSSENAESNHVADEKESESEAPDELDEAKDSGSFDAEQTESPNERKEGAENADGGNDGENDERLEELRERIQEQCEDPAQLDEDPPSVIEDEVKSDGLDRQDQQQVEDASEGVVSSSQALEETGETEQGITEKDLEPSNSEGRDEITEGLEELRGRIREQHEVNGEEDDNHSSDPQDCGGSGESDGSDLESPKRTTEDEAEDVKPSAEEPEDLRELERSNTEGREEGREPRNNEDPDDELEQLRERMNEQYEGTVEDNENRIEISNPNQVDGGEAPNSGSTREEETGKIRSDEDSLTAEDHQEQVETTEGKDEEAAQRGPTRETPPSEQSVNEEEPDGEGVARTERDQDLDQSARDPELDAARQLPVDGVTAKVDGPKATEKIDEESLKSAANGEAGPETLPEEAAGGSASRGAEADNQSPAEFVRVIEKGPDERQETEQDTAKTDIDSEVAEKPTMVRPDEPDAKALFRSEEEVGERNAITESGAVPAEESTASRATSVESYGPTSPETLSEIPSRVIDESGGRALGDVEVEHFQPRFPDGSIDSGGDLGTSPEARGETPDLVAGQPLSENVVPKGVSVVYEERSACRTG
jgi:hypothetical protein